MYVSSVLRAFEKDVLPNYFGIEGTSRNTIKSHTSEIAKSLFDVQEDQLMIICDGTYIRHQKSQNNLYQKKSFSGQEKTSLCKPFTICTTDGYVVDMLGPFNANANDAQIMKQILQNPNDLVKLLKPGDIIIFDRGFRDVIADLEAQHYKVLMPALKGNRAQFSVVESNKSRLVTKIRWSVEAVHGILKQKHKLFDQKLDNKLLPKIGSLCRIACFLKNKYGKPLISGVGISDEIVDRLKLKGSEQINSLFEEVESNGWLRKKVNFSKMSSNDLLDFPELNEQQLKIFFGGTYQLSQAVSYLAELLNSDGSIDVQFAKDAPDLLRIKIKSRHIGKKMYSIFIHYQPNSNDIIGIKRHYCSCPNGSRTAGSCSHIAAIIYYLSYARYLSRIIKPAQILSNIFDFPIIEEDSEEE